MRDFVLRVGSGLLLLATLSCGGQSYSIDDDESTAALSSIDPGYLVIGYADNSPNMLLNPNAALLFSGSDGTQRARHCHYYAPWDLAERLAGDADLANWSAYLTSAQRDPATGKAIGAAPCDVAVTLEIRITNPSTPVNFDAAFKAFRRRWPGITEFVAPNEPNMPPTRLTPEDAATYYLSMRRACTPDTGCIVAAGNICGWSSGSDGSNPPSTAFLASCSSNPDALCQTGSYLDQYKYWVDARGVSFGLAGHRPEHWAFHPWGDAFAYMERLNHCNPDGDCATKVFRKQLGGSWSKSYIWATEVGLDRSRITSGALDFYPNATNATARQTCGGVFLQRLFGQENAAGDGLPKIDRLYYYAFSKAYPQSQAQVSADGSYIPSGDTSLVEYADENTGTNVRPLMDVLRNRQITYPASCP